MDVREYLNRFYLFEGDLNSDYLSKLLYTSFLSRFQDSYSAGEYLYFREYQERVSDLVEDMRQLDVPTIQSIFDYLLKVDIYLVDVIIMSWCLPRVANYYSRRSQYSKYRELIEKYLPKLTQMIDHEAIKNFSCDILGKTNYVPIHCIDLLWYYMNGVSIKLSFYNMQSAEYLGIVYKENDEHSPSGRYSGSTDDGEFIEVGFNMIFLLESSLGNVTGPGECKGSFRCLLKNLLSNEEVVRGFLDSESGSNFSKQWDKIRQNSLVYFGNS